MPVWVLGATVLFAWWRVYIVLNDPHHGEVANAYETAQQWDEHVTAVEASAAMQLDFEIIEISSSGKLIASFTDKDAKPLQVENLQLSAYHNAYPSQKVVVALNNSADGLYRAEIGAVRSGVWQLDLQASINGEAWIHHQRIIAPLK